MGKAKRYFSRQIGYDSLRQARDRLEKLKRKVDVGNETIPSRLMEQAKSHPNAPAFHVRDGGVWNASSYSDYVAEVRLATRALITLGFEPTQTTTILGFNRPEWVVMDLATMSAGGAPAGIYATCSPEEVAYIVNHSECPLILVENEAQFRKIESERANLPHLKHIVTMKGTPKLEGAMSWEEFLAKADETEDSVVDERIAALDPNALATLIYTSGTTGPPKGVMLSHENLAWTADAAVKMVSFTASDSTLSYLPLSHIAEQMFSIHGPITAGASVYFSESIEKVPDNLKEVQPTVFFGVPRIWEKFHAGISGKMKLATGFKAKLVGWAKKKGMEATMTRSTGGTPGGIGYAIANKLVFSKLKPAVGLGRARICVTGAAPIAPEVLEFFASLDIPVMEVYGQSEDTGPTTFNQPNKFKFGTVGPAVPGVEVKLADDEEILVRGPNVFLGYYKDEDATNDTLKDGWLYSGDLGAWDGDFLKIIGRKKEIIITAGGKNIAPKNIEAELKNHELINEAVVIGDRRKYLSAVVTIDPDLGAAWAADNGEDAAKLHESAKLREDIQKWVTAMNEKFARVEQIKKFAILSRNFTVEDGELTPTLKVKRRKVNESFASEIEAMYE
ncbi:MAG: long-chain acyl-CoA synthetase [Polyangiales bacterium]|jgi:long-chain acyl-CoA synthetase